MRHYAGLIFIIMTLLVASRPSQATAPLIFSGLWGGELADEGRAIVADADGNLYVAGMSQSPALPTTNATSAAQHGVDAFVAKISADGSTIDYIYWFNATSASDVDESFGIALAPDGGPIVVGHTRSADFCTIFGTVPGYDTVYNGNSDAFAFKIKPDGSGLAYCTFLGGNDWDLASAVVSASDGSAILTGGTWSADFPIPASAPFPTHSGQRDAFVARLSPDGMQLTSATFFGGSGQEEARAIVGDGAGRFLITGWTNSADLPTTPNVTQPDYAGDFDGFVVAFSPTGTLDFATYLGTAAEDRPTALATTNRQIAVAGTLFSGLESSGFVTLLSSDATTLNEFARIGGSGDESISAVAFDAHNQLLLAGTTNSADFPISAAAFQPRLAGERDAFVMRLTAGLTPDYSSFLGGSRDDAALALVPLPDQHIALTGSSASADFPITPDSFGPTYTSDSDMFVSAIQLPPAADAFAIYLPFLCAPSSAQK